VKVRYKRHRKYVIDKKILLRSLHIAICVMNDKLLSSG
jgi:hypothetical protein